MTPSARTLAFSIALLALVAGSLGLGSAIRVAKLHLQKKGVYSRERPSLLSLPRETAGWIQVGRDMIEAADVEEQLGTTNYVSRYYRAKPRADGRTPGDLDFHAAYYTNQIDTVPHVPERCMTGAGWQIRQLHGALPIPLDRSTWRKDRDDDLLPSTLRGRIDRVRLSNESEFPGREVRLPVGLIRAPRQAPDGTTIEPGELRLRVSEFFDGQSKGSLFAGYFFIANGSPASGANEVRLRSFDLRNEYAYYLKVQFGSRSARSAEELCQDAADFLGEFLGEIMLAVPDWAEVEMGAWPPKE